MKLSINTQLSIWRALCIRVLRFPFLSIYASYHPVLLPCVFLVLIPLIYSIKRIPLHYTDPKRSLYKRYMTSGASHWIHPSCSKYVVKRWVLVMNITLIVHRNIFDHALEYLHHPVDRYPSFPLIIHAPAIYSWYHGIVMLWAFQWTAFNEIKHKWGIWSSGQLWYKPMCSDDS